MGIIAKRKEKKEWVLKRERERERDRERKQEEEVEVVVERKERIKNATRENRDKKESEKK